MSEAETTPQAVAAGEASGLPALPRRLFDAFFSPGKMTREVAAEPRWLGALLVSAALLVLSTSLIPPELFAETQRRVALERGIEVPVMTERALQTIRIASIVGSGLAFTIFSFFFAGVYTLIFAFILGDEGRYKQYLAVSAHAAIIPALISLPLAPLRIATGDPQFTLNLASFLLFLPDSYFLNVLRMLDLTQVWSTLVVALGAHAIDPRRSFASAAGILLAILLLVALVIARFLPT